MESFLRKLPFDWASRFTAGTQLQQHLCPYHTPGACQMDLLRQFMQVVAGPFAPERQDHGKVHPCYDVDLVFVQKGKRDIGRGAPKKICE